VLLAALCQVSDLFPVGCFIVVGDQAYQCRVVSKLNNVVGVVPCHTVLGEQGVQGGTKHAPLWDPRGRCGVAYPHRLGAGRQSPESSC
jgi:hypothetical protein